MAKSYQTTVILSRGDQKNLRGASASRPAGGSGDEHGVPYVHGRPDFRSGNTFFKTSENGHQWEDPATFAALSWDIVSGIYRHGKPVNSLIRALFCSGVYGYRQKEEAP